MNLNCFNPILHGKKNKRLGSCAENHGHAGSFNCYMACSTVITSYIVVVCVGSVLVDEIKANSFLRRFDQDSSSTDIVQECCKEGCHVEEVWEYC